MQKHNVLKMFFDFFHT